MENETYNFSADTAYQFLQHIQEVRQFGDFDFDPDAVSAAWQVLNQANWGINSQII